MQFAITLVRINRKILLKQIHQLDINLPLFSNYVFETPSVLVLEPALLRNVEYTFPQNSSNENLDKMDYDRRFQALFGKESKPTINTYFVQDGLVLLRKALANCKVDSATCIGNYFKSVENYNGLSGLVSFRPDGSNDRPYGIKQVKNGAFTWVSD